MEREKNRKSGRERMAIERERRRKNKKKKNKRDGVQVEKILMRLKGRCVKTQSSVDA